MSFFSLLTNPTLARLTGVYFKSLYSSSQEVKDVAHEGLRMVLTHQSRLPKELLQTGLRPILMNLADPKRLSVPGLEGLARLLELLTNYFKVEVGHKLLDHFRFVADPQLLQESSKSSITDNEGITKLVRLANIFHLLPSTANIFLDQLVNAIVQTEAQMHFSTQSPFSEPLARYLNRYPSEGIDFFLRHLSYSRHLRTLRSILQAKLAPNLLRELAARTPVLVTRLRASMGNDRNVVAAILNLFQDLATLIPSWMAENDYAIAAVVDLWQCSFPSQENLPSMINDVAQKYRLMLAIFTQAMKESPRIDLLFEITSVFTFNLGIDLVSTSIFLYEHVASRNDSFFKRSILNRFLTWFTNSTHSEMHKAHFLRYIVSPILLIHANRWKHEDRLIDADFIGQIHQAIWLPMSDSTLDTSDIYKVEILHLTTLLVQYYPELLEDSRKDIMKGAWSYASSCDDAIVKQTAYLLAAHFSAAFPTPQKFILRAWTNLLRMPHSEGRVALRHEALSILAPSLPKSEVNESGHPLWAKTTRKFLVEEGIGSMITIYHLIVKQPQLFFPVRSLFVPHIANSLNKLGVTATSGLDLRLLSVEILQVIFQWEEQATQTRKVQDTGDTPKDDSIWLTPLNFRENMVSYLVRLTTGTSDQPSRITLLPKAFSLLQRIVGPSGWTDVTVGLRFFLRSLEQVSYIFFPTLYHSFR